MELINRAINQVEYLGGCNASYVMAHALWSACDHRKHTTGPNLLEISANLDSGNQSLFMELARITHQPGYSNDAQAKALQWLREGRFVDFLKTATGHGENL